MIYNWQHVKISRNFSAQGLTVAFTLGFEHIAGSRRAKCLAKWTGSHAFFPSEKVDIIKGTLWLKTQKISLISKTFIFFPKSSEFENFHKNHISKISKIIFYSFAFMRLFGIFLYKNKEKLSIPRYLTDTFNEATAKEIYHITFWGAMKKSVFLWKNSLFG